MRKTILSSIIYLTAISVAHATTLTSGVTKSDTVSKGQWQYYQIPALSDQTRLTVALTGLSDDADLYVRNGSQPTLSSYACRPYKEGKTDEICGLSVIASSQIHIGVYGFHAASYDLKINLGSDDNDLSFPATGTDWYAIIGSDNHTSTGGYENMDDTYAIDLNRPSNNDDGLRVTPVANGTVIARSTSLGFVLVQHDSVLTLGDGTTQNPWFSGYMHMSGTLPELETVVTPNSMLGNISNVGAGSDHLHFAIYSGDASDISGMTSIDIGNKLIDFYRHNLSKWYEWCGNTSSATHVVDRPWWDSDTAPCPYPTN
ncbi:pre-peptidase C-terminal domain-containing protein [Pseudoalteromonas xiamenensis]|uniref:pre-peptidase C-terminal domain-containing protein n=1 Tax=Pseudoalteromonas xiamenensis TaxID=882626 RepID=UPI0035E56E6E